MNILDKAFQMLDVPMTTTYDNINRYALSRKGQISNIINIKGMQGLSALLHCVCPMASFVDVEHLMKSHALNFYHQLKGDLKAERRMG